MALGFFRPANKVNDLSLSIITNISVGEQSLATRPTEQLSSVKYSLLIEWQQKQNSKIIYNNQIVVLHLNLTFLVCMYIEVCLWILINLLDLPFKHWLWDILLWFYRGNLFSYNFWRGWPWAKPAINLYALYKSRNSNY